MKNQKIIDAYNTVVPSEDSRERVRDRIEERENGLSGEGGRKVRWMPRAAAAVGIVLVLTGGVTAYAMWRYLSPTEVAEEIEDKKLTEGFQSGPAIDTKGERQQYGEYNVVLLGLLSGEDLTDYETETNGEVEKDRTYCVVAIERADGSPMADGDAMENLEQSFMVSPYIQGKDPRRINIFTMGGGAITFMKDGILYKVVDCDSLTAFADKKIYLAVTDGDRLIPEIKVVKKAESGTEAKAGEKVVYIYDKNTGEVRRNENYKGLNALFTLPMDESLADPDKAAETMKKWTGADEGEEAEEEDESEDPEDKKVHDYLDENTEEVIQKEFTLMEENTQTVKPDQDGVYHFEWKFEEEEDGAEGRFTGTKEEIFAGRKNLKPGAVVCTGYSIGDDYVLTQLFRLNKDGSVTVMPYRKKISEIPEEK